MPSPEEYAAKKLASIPGNSKPGPRTPEGQARSKMNALRHGLSGRIVVLPSEDMGQYLKFSRDFVDSLYPATSLESELAQTVADGYWRLKRFRTVEEGMLAMGRYEEGGDFDAENQEIHSAFSPEPPADRPYPREVEAEQSAIGQAKAFRANSQSFVNLSIYEQRIQRGIEKSMKQLREVQTERKEHRKSEMEEVLRLRDYNKMKNLPYNPTDDGFVYASAEIEIEANRRDRRYEARFAEKSGFNYNYAEFRKRAA